MIFIKLSQDGTIEQVVERTTAPHLSNHMIDISHMPEARDISNNPSNFYFVGGHPQRKMAVQLLPSKLMLKADGKDVVIVKVQTKSTQPIKLKVGVREVEVAPNSDLEITSESLGIITVSLNDPLLTGSAISVYAGAVHED